MIVVAAGASAYFYFFQKPEEQVEDKSDLIKVSSPRPNERVKTPLKIIGEARGTWFFEASFPIELLDENGNSMTIVVAQAKEDWMTENFVPFEATIDFPPGSSGKGILVFKKDNPSGLPEFDDELRMPIIFEPQEAMRVKAFFNNSNLDPEFSCNKVFPVEREVVKTQAVARAALEELLKGIVARKEVEEGFFTSLNSGVKIQSLTVENGVARVDFDDALEFQIGGSCRVSAIRAQITETLKQFPTVSQVIISINGRTEDILQP